MSTYVPRKPRVKMFDISDVFIAGSFEDGCRDAINWLRRHGFHIVWYKIDLDDRQLEFQFSKKTALGTTTDKAIVTPGELIVLSNQNRNIEIWNREVFYSDWEPENALRD